ncbi:uncharacterized protein LOC110252895, partial [Exaiptasia diaphana]|uniref:Ig-like domain-containing protein n=1 Tax=Exaiptasia diaphana TaxID=2652724 RepID=A0A913Y7J3_EXADI
VSHSLNGTDWIFYKDDDREGSQVKNFTGNTDATGYVTNLFNRDILARHIRIHPVTWHKTTDYPCMRATALGRRTGFLGSPVFTTQERSYITAYSNQHITLNCDAVGDTPMTFTWIYEGQVIQNKTDQPSLILTNVTKSNKGFYTCNASNAIGVYSKNLYLHVKESFEVCTRYQTIVDNSRWVGATSIASSDTTFNESDWYVFKDSHNNFYQIPTTCVPQKHCGALAPGKGAIDQLAIGFGPLLELAKEHPDTMKTLFVGSSFSEPINSSALLKRPNCI